MSQCFVNINIDILIIIIIIILIEFDFIVFNVCYPLSEKLSPSIVLESSIINEIQRPESYRIHQLLPSNLILKRSMNSLRISGNLVLILTIQYHVF